MTEEERQAIARDIKQMLQVFSTATFPGLRQIEPGIYGCVVYDPEPEPLQAQDRQQPPAVEPSDH